MSVSIRELHRLTATAVEHHKALHAHHKHVAHGVAKQRAANVAAGLKPDGTPLSGTPAGFEGTPPVGGGHG